MIVFLYDDVWKPTNYALSSFNQLLKTHLGLWLHNGTMWKSSKDGNTSNLTLQ